MNEDYYTNLDDQQGYNGSSSYSQQTGNGGLSAYSQQSDQGFYSDRTFTPQQETDQSTIDTYYSNSPYTRAQYLKSPDYKDRRMFIRITGFCLALFMVIDFFRLYNKNVNIELDNELWLAEGCFLFIAVCEVIIQLYMFRSAAFAEIVLVAIFSTYVNRSMLFLPPLGLIMLICSAYHVEQAIVFDQKWKHYQRINSD